MLISLVMNNEPNQETRVCHICNSQNFIWGRAVGERTQWEAKSVYFLAYGGEFGQGEELNARKCLDCTNVQLFTGHNKYY